MRQLALVVVALALVPTAARALIPEPPHVVRGAVTVNGAPRTWGTVTLRLAGSPEAIASFALGTLPGTANGYVLAVPMDALDPRAAGTARSGDAAQILLDATVAAEANGLCRLAVTLLDARGAVLARDEGQGLFTIVPKP